ncbi:MAG: L,D-transpeptidase/peptidoglycan binding protein [Coriobacteriia bacterium]|nr:L,D-transpeptidase/peptidoglycan binding protein [Coriobacteriia bacterium]
MHRAPTHLRILACIAACACFVLSAGAAAAIAQDYVSRDVLAPGSAVATTSVGGMRLSEAKQAIERDLAASFGQTMTVMAGQRTVQVQPSQFLRVDLARTLGSLAQAKGRTPTARRLLAQATGAPYGTKVPPQIAVDRAALDAWVATLAASVGTPASDATLTVQDRQLVAIPERVGFSIDPRKAADAVAVALARGDDSVRLPVTRIEPKVTREDLGMAILVRRADRRLFLYEDGRLVKVYRVAVGAPGFPTPRGRWTIVRKRYMPTWGNPGSDWAKDMPRFIPPGPNNPLGTRALDLSAPGIRIHGTNKDYSIGQAASHGCMRMHRWDIEDLYDRVPVGTPVFIID